MRKGLTDAGLSQDVDLAGAKVWVGAQLFKSGAGINLVCIRYVLGRLRCFHDFPRVGIAKINFAGWNIGSVICFHLEKVGLLSELHEHG